jgi:acyl-CoA-binding protein
MDHNTFVAVFGGGGKSVGFCDEYKAVYNSFTTPPSSLVAAAQDRMVRSLVSAGVWAKLDLFYLFAQESNGDSEALKNWVNPGTFDASLVGAPAFTSLEGIKGNGVDAAIDTGYGPSTDGVNLTLNSNSFGAYSRTNVSEAAALVGQSGGQFYLYPRHPVLGNTAIARTNDIANLVSADQSDSTGMWIASRTASDARALYRNKDLRDSDNQATAPLTATDWWFLAIHSGAGLEWSTHQISAAFVGGGLTQGESDAATDAIEAYMDSNEKGVIT